MRLFILLIILILTLMACSGKSKTTKVLPFELSDTITRTQITKYSDLDSFVEYETITFTPNNLNVSIDSFYYEAISKDQSENYRIYFDRRSVISYCDSMLKALGAETFENFNAIQMYSAIKTHFENRFAETIFHSETHYLMNRFRPLIINHKTKHKPSYYFTITRKSSEREDVVREFVTENGDTLGLSWENIWISDIQNSNIQIDTTK